MQATTDDAVYRAARLVLLTVLGIVGLTLLAVLLAGIWSRLAPAPPAAYAAGERVDVPREHWEGHRGTLIVFGRSSCGRCQQARGFLASLVAEAGRWDDVQTVFVTGGWHLPDEVAFAAALGIPEAAVVPLAGDLRVARVPTVLFVSGDGTIRLASEDLPDEAGQQEVVRALGRLAAELGRP